MTVVRPQRAGGKHARHTSQRISYKLQHHDPSANRDARVWERSTKPGSWCPISLTDPAIELPPPNAYVPPSADLGAAAGASSPSSSSPSSSSPSSPNQSPSMGPKRASRLPTLTVGPTDKRSILLDDDEISLADDPPEQPEQPVFMPAVMDQALLNMLTPRGKGRYCCPDAYDCRIGGVDKKTGRLMVFSHNSAFRQHIERHMKPFKCDKPGCWKKSGFARPHTLRMHKGSCGTQRQQREYEEAAQRGCLQGPLVVR